MEEPLWKSALGRLAWVVLTKVECEGIVTTIPLSLQKVICILVGYHTIKLPKVWIIKKPKSLKNLISIIGS